MDEGLSSTGRRLVGYAVRWGQPALIRQAGRTFEERFARGAFARSLAAGDVRLCVEHDYRAVVACQSDGSLHLVEDHVGLLVDATALHTADGDDALAAVRCRSRAGLSVGFDHGAAARWSDEDGVAVREVTDCRLREISICRNPAYRTADVHAGKLRIQRFLSEAAVAAQITEAGRGGSYLCSGTLAGPVRPLSALIHNSNVEGE
jgi:HK97 family phage prohead protease